MNEREAERVVGLSGVRRELSAWRARHGGRGRPIPPQLWERAVAVARVEGIAATARALGVDRGRLARLASAASTQSDCLALAPKPASAEFVELDARVVCGGGQTVVHFSGGDGERVRVELSGASGVDLVALAKAFWSRSRCCS